MHRVHRRVALGVEFNPQVGELGPLATIFLRHESERLPALSVGTSSDRIGSPEGKASVYLTASKQLPRIPLSGYLSLNWSEWDEQFNVPFGGNLQLGEVFTLRSMYDGERSHLMLSATRGRYSLSALWLWLEDLGVSISVGLGSDE